MKRAYYIFILLVCIILGSFAPAAPAQDNTVTPDESFAWLTIDSGHAVYLNPETMDWIPLSNREKVNLKTYLLTHEGAQVTLYHQASVYPLPPSSYLFLEDVVAKNRNQVVMTLTQIEAEQLPVPEETPGNESRKIGITYGNKATLAGQEYPSIPYLDERYRAVTWFLENRRDDVSLLLLKRMMTQYPVLYKDRKKFNLLCTLYENLEFFGFLHNETQLLLQMDINDELEMLARGWLDRLEGKIRNE